MQILTPLSKSLNYIIIGDSINQEITWFKIRFKNSNNEYIYNIQTIYLQEFIQYMQNKKGLNAYRLINNFIKRRIIYKV